MPNDIVIEMMTKDFILWRCLHSGPLTRKTIDQLPSNNKMPWEQYRARNKALLTKLTDVYGACVVVARDGDNIIGKIRFYPKTICKMKDAGSLCLQQDYPIGPSDDFTEMDFPPLDKLEDKTLKVHCLMIGSPGQEKNPYQRKGIGSRMVKTLIDWARENGWKQIETDSFEDLPIIYQTTGSAGHTFWENLGFKMVDRFPHPYLCEYKEFVTTLEEQAKSAGIDPEKAKDSIVMRFDL